MKNLLLAVLDKHYDGRWKTFPSSTGTMDDFGNIVWIGDAPNKSDFQAQYNWLEQVYNNTQYQRDRALAYDPIPEQLDEIYHKGLTEWKKTIKKVKDAHPKPSE